MKNQTNNNAEAVIPNPARSSVSAEYVKHTPQYLLLGIQPDKVDFPVDESGGEYRVASVDEMTEDNPRIKSNFFAVPEEDHKPSQSIPNVGVNEDQLWGQTVPEKHKVEDMSDKDYVLVAKDQIVLVGTLNQIEREVSAVFYGEHKLCDPSTTIDDLIVLKKLKIKVGVFVE